MSIILKKQQEYAAAVDLLGTLAGDQAAYDAQMAKVKSLGGEVTNLKNHEALAAELAKEYKPAGNPGSPKPGEVDKGLSPTVAAEPKEVLEKGAALSRIVISLAHSKGNRREAHEFASKQWGENSEVVKALAASSGPNGGYLVPENLSAEFIELLRPESVVLRLGPRDVPMPNGNITIPGMATGSNAAYVGENMNILKTEPTLRQIKMTAKKLAALVPISNDMMRYPSRSGDAFVREDLVAALAQKADLTMLRGMGGEFSPLGLLAYAITAGGDNYIDASAMGATPTVAQVTSLLARMELAMMNANLQMRKTRWIFSGRTMLFLMNMRDANGNLYFPEMANGNLRGKGFAWTNQVPDNIGTTFLGSEIYLVEFSEFLHAQAIGLEITVADGVTYFNGNELVSGFSQDQTVIRALMAHDTGLRQPKAVVVATDVRWTP